MRLSCFKYMHFHIQCMNDGVLYTYTQRCFSALKLRLVRRKEHTRYGVPYQQKILARCQPFLLLHSCLYLHTLKAASTSYHLYTYMYIYLTCMKMYRFFSKLFVVIFYGIGSRAVPWFFPLVLQSTYSFINAMYAYKHSKSVMHQYFAYIYICNGIILPVSWKVSHENKYM